MHPTPGQGGYAGTRWAGTRWDPLGRDQVGRDYAWARPATALASPLRERTPSLR